MSAPTPTLDRLAAAGMVWYADGEWIGRASDGTEVSFGAEREGAERYLQAHPSPTEW